MRITYLHQYFNTPEMSGGTRSYEMARRLVAKGHEVNMVTSWREEDGRKGWFETEEAGIRVHWLPVPYSNSMGYGERIRAFFRFAWKAAHKAAALQADVVFATSTPLTIALPGAYAAWRRKAPMVFEVRDLWPDVPIAIGAIRNPVLVIGARLLEKFAYKRAARVVALAPGMRDAVGRKGYDIRRTAVIPNGADLNEFKSPKISAHIANLETRYPWIKRGILIVYIGTIGIANGVEYIPRLAKALNRQAPEIPITFAILGDGRQLEAVKSIASELEVIDKNVFFIGRVPKKQVPVWLNQCSAAIMTYDGPEILYRDSVSNKFFDSLAAGKPIIANFKGFSTSIAEAKGAGIILPKHNFKKAAQILQAWLTDENRLSFSQKQALNLAKEYFNRDCLADDLDMVLESAVNAPNGKMPINIGRQYLNLINNL